jgi:Mn2+/Fe2+ NRAMP family transporter
MERSRRGSEVFWYIAALVGNSVAPFAIFYQGSADIDKGLISKYLRLGRIDTLVGCVVETLVAACAIVAGAALVGQIPDLESAGPASIITSNISRVGSWAGILFGLGIFNAGLLAAFTVSLSTSWTVAEAFGWARSLGDRLTEAPKFYAVYLGSIALAGLPRARSRHLSGNLKPIRIDVHNPEHFHDWCFQTAREGPIGLSRFRK